jgi:hypothetical protein
MNLIGEMVRQKVKVGAGSQHPPPPSSAVRPEQESLAGFWTIRELRATNVKLQTDVFRSSERNYDHALAANVSLRVQGLEHGGKV